MTSAWEQFQEIVKEKMREHFSEIVVEHALNPRNVGDIEEYSGLADYTGPCGDSMQIWLKVEDEKITDASFMTDGWNLDQKTVLKELGGLPEEKEHCALLAERTLKQAIDDYLKRKSEAQ